MALPEDPPPRSVGAIPPQPVQVDNPNAQYKAITIRESEFSTVTGLRNSTNTTRLATGQANIGRNLVELAETLQPTGRGFSHVPNVLDQYANYTYHVRWSLTNDVDGSNVSSKAEFENIKKVVVAESGVTSGFNITEFEMDNTCAPGQKNQMSLNVSWRMTIKEPYGLSLLDKVYSVSRTMGVKNHLTNSCFIELWFTGYNEDGTIATPDMYSSLYKLFRVIITKMDTDTTDAGTTYSISGYFDNMFANSNHVMISPALNIGPVKTIGDFFAKFESELNIIQDDLENKDSRTITYKFNVPAFMRDWEFSQNPTTSTRSSSISEQDQNNLTNPTISISKGMDLNTILTQVVSMTKQGQQFVLGDPRPPGTGVAPGSAGSSSTSANGGVNVILIHSNATLIGFDYITNDYVRKITYTFTRFESSRAVVDPATAAATQQPAQQNDKHATLVASKRYNKVYEYIFTGRNLDIIRFDIKLNWFWQSPIPNQLGNNVYSNWTTPPLITSGSSQISIIDKYNTAKKRLAKAQAERDVGKRKYEGMPASEWTQNDLDRLKLWDEEVKQATQEVSSFGKSRRRFQILWENLSPGQQAQAGASAAANNRGILVGDSGLLEDTRVINDIKNIQIWKQQQGDPRINLYLEDVPTVVAENPIPLSFVPTNNPIGQASSVGGDNAPPETVSNSNSSANLPKGRSLISTVLNDLTSSPSLVQANLEIRGDPYWLGMGNIEENRIIQTPSQKPEDLTRAAWFFSGDVGFLLVFRSGEAPNEETGLMDFTSDANAFTGLYNVFKVRSLFSDGKFTQTLEAARDLLYLPKTVTNNNTPASMSVLDL